MKKVLLLLVATLLVITLSACGNDNDPDNLVYVTVYPMQFLVEEIAGDLVTVRRVPGSTVHSESIDWTGKEIISMLNSDLLFYVNAGLDTYIDNTKDTTFREGSVTIVDISQYIEYNEVCFSHDFIEGDDDLDGCDETQLSDDPHFWLDPFRMSQAAEMVKDILSLTYPEYSEDFATNYSALYADLDTLNADYEAMSLEVTKPLITTTMLFTYYAVRYNLDIHPISTSAHATEETAENLIAFVELAEENDLAYIIFEKNANSPSGDSVLTSYQEIYPDAERLYMHGLGNLTDEEIDAGLNYMSIMYANLNVLQLSTK
jgi:zinc transport system substrate-binding protein